MRTLYFAAITVLLFAAPPAMAQDFSGVEKTVVFRAQGDYETRNEAVEVEEYAWYRIPAIVCTAEGTLLAFCEGRKTRVSDHGNIDLVLRRSEDLGKTWGPIEVVYEEGGAAKITIGNPCPVIDRSTGTIWLPFTRDNDHVFITKSEDDGRTWSEPVDVTSSVKAPGWTWYATGPGVGIQLERGPHAGRMVIPCDHRERKGGASNDEHVKKSHCFYSDDHGKTWILGESVGDYTDECQVVETVDGRLLINMRNYWGREGNRPDRAGKRVIAYSEDGGHSWGPLGFDETLISPICQASFLRYTTETNGGANRVLFSNPASTNRRHNLTVRMSLDEGKTWPVSRLLDDGHAAYSNLVVLPDNTIGCLYERGDNYAYETIVFARFTRAWLEGRE